MEYLKRICHTSPALPFAKISLPTFHNSFPTTYPNVKTTLEAAQQSSYTLYSTSIIYSVLPKQPITAQPKNNIHSYL